MEVRRLMARVYTILIPTRVSEAVENCQIVCRIDIKTHPSTSEVKERVKGHCVHSCKAKERDKISIG